MCQYGDWQIKSVLYVVLIVLYLFMFLFGDIMQRQNKDKYFKNSKYTFFGDEFFTGQLSL